MSITINGATNTISSTGTVTMPTIGGITSTGNSALGDAEASDTHAIKGATTILSNSASAALTVTQTGAGNAFVVEDSASTDSTPFVIDANGKVGIGTTPQASSLTTLDLRLASFTSDGTNSGFFTNAYYDGAWRYRESSKAVATYQQNGADHIFSNAVAGTAGASFGSPTECMRIDSAGSVGIGAAPSAGINLDLQKDTVGAANAFAISARINPDSTVGTSAVGVGTYAVSAASSTTPAIRHFYANQGSFSGTHASQSGYLAEYTLTGATNNYGFYSNIASAANRYNFYAAGTAANAFSGDVKIFGAGALGYSTGSGGTITQATSRTTGVTLNKTNGQITMFSAAGSATAASFTVTNSTVAATDTIVLSVASGTNKYMVFVTAVAAGSFEITFQTTGGTSTDAPVINFAVIKAVSA